jgi:hypothetical protein
VKILFVSLGPPVKLPDDFRALEDLLFLLRSILPSWRVPAGDCLLDLDGVELGPVWNKAHREGTGCHRLFLTSFVTPLSGPSESAAGA